MEGSRSKEGKSEFIIFLAKIHTAKGDLRGRNISSEGNLSTSMWKFQDRESCGERIRVYRGNGRGKDQKKRRD